MEHLCLCCAFPLFECEPIALHSLSLLCVPTVRVWAVTCIHFHCCAFPVKRHSTCSASRASHRGCFVAMAGELHCLGVRTPACVCVPACWCARACLSSACRRHIVLPWWAWGGCPLRSCSVGLFLWDFCFVLVRGLAGLAGVCNVGLFLWDFCFVVVRGLAGLAGVYGVCSCGLDSCFVLEEVLAGFVFSL